MPWSIAVDHHVRASPAASNSKLPFGSFTQAANRGLALAVEIPQTDPVTGGSANSYDYSSQDPVNSFDLNGKWCLGVCWHTVRHAASSTYHWAGHHKLDIAMTAASFAPGIGEVAWGARLLWAARGIRVIRGGEEAGIAAKVEYNSLRYGSRRFVKLDRPDRVRPYYHWVHGKMTGSGERAFNHYSWWGHRL